MKAFRLFCQGNNLQADLWQLTDTGYVDSSSHLLNRVVKACSDPDDRHVIMRHLQEHLSISSNWRHLLGGLTLLLELVKHGPSMLFVEIGNGYHFDPVQRLSFLENFQYAEDPRVQKLIRNKAMSLRTALMQRMRSGDTCRDDGKSISSSDKYALPKWRQGPINGLVVIGHHEDTDHESEDEILKPSASVASTQSTEDLLEGDWWCVDTGDTGREGREVDQSPWTETRS